MFRKLLLAAGLWLTAALVAPGAYARVEYFTINDYHSDITVEPNGRIEVVENIRLTFDTPRHGIFRDIPVRYVTDRGDHYETPLSVLSVTDGQGNDRTYDVSRDGSVKRIKIGDADKFVSGEQVYVIKYRVERMVTFFKDHDELFWNVTGNDWKAPIEAVSATITLKTEKAVTQPQGACYTGRYGSRESACTYSFSGNTARFECSRPLDAGEGFTVVFGFDRGLIAEPTGWQKFWWAVDLRNNWAAVIPLITLVWMFSAWWRRGRDPRTGESVAVQYEPPKMGGRSMNAAEVGVLIDESLDQRDISGAIIGLASQGYVKIQEGETERVLFSSTDYILTKLKPADDQLSQFERHLLSDLFEDGNEVRVSALSGKFYSHITDLRDELYDGLTDQRLFVRNPLKVRSTYTAMAFVVGVVTAVLSFFTATTVPLVGWGSGLLAGGIVALFGRIMPARTRQGVHIRQLIRGFQEFMMRADKDRLERMGADLFYKYLPYAIALNVTDQWAHAFAGLSLQPPNWYVPMSGYTMFNPVLFSHQISAGAGRIGNAAFSAPRGSGLSGGGGGGGGFSGGGGGGGGGGSW